MHPLLDSAFRNQACREVPCLPSARKEQRVRGVQQHVRVHTAKPRRQALFAALRSGQQQTEQLWARKQDGVAAGSLSLFLGCMFAGKSSLLIDTLLQAEASGKKVLALKSAVDTRYGSLQEIRTHNGLSKPCYAVAKLADVHNLFQRELDAAEVVGIDEAHFFPDLLQFCTLTTDALRKHVYVAGLDGDFKRRRFGQVLDLVPLADEVTKLRCGCKPCEIAGRRRDALFSLRIVANESQELVGGADTYLPVCRQHYNELSDVRPGPKSRTSVEE